MIMFERYLQSTSILVTIIASQVQAAARGEASLFKLRLTLLGTGNSALSVSWLHILFDGELSRGCKDLRQTYI